MSVPRKQRWCPFRFEIGVGMDKYAELIIEIEKKAPVLPVYPLQVSKRAICISWIVQIGACSVACSVRRSDNFVLPN